MVDFSPLKFVPYEERFQEGLIQLLSGCYAEYDQVVELDTLDADLLEIPKKYAEPSRFGVLLDTQDGAEKVVGSVAIKVYGEGQGELKRVFLNAAYRGQGLGKRMSQQAFAWAAQAGCHTVAIWSDCLFKTAHHLYRGMGAEDTGKVRYIGGRNKVSEFYFELRLHEHTLSDSAKA